MVTPGTEFESPKAKREDHLAIVWRDEWYSATVGSGANLSGIVIYGVMPIEKGLERGRRRLGVSRDWTRIIGCICCDKEDGFIFCIKSSVDQTAEEKVL